jgi:transcriptional regulator with XRE-family HTH domain
MPPRDLAPFYELGQAIKEARNARGVTQRELAENAGMSLRQVALVEAGENVSLSFIEKIVDYLDIRELPLGRALVRVKRGEAKKLNALAKDARILASNIAQLLLAVKFREDDQGGMIVETQRAASASWADDLIGRFEQLHPDAKQIFLDHIATQHRLADVATPASSASAGRRSASRKRGASGSSRRG